MELFARSDDSGRTWSFVGGPVLAEQPRGLATLDDGTLVALTDEQIWWTVDREAWSTSPLPGRVDLIRGGALLRLAGAGRARRPRPGRRPPRTWRIAAPVSTCTYQESGGLSDGIEQAIARRNGADTARHSRSEGRRRSANNVSRKG